MRESQTLESRLGYRPGQKLLIVHADDLGLSNSGNQAWIRAQSAGLVTCGSIMVPCPWFLQFAAYARENPGLDLGLHLTLTSEWSNYRWRPIASRDKVPGLVDEQGFLWRLPWQVKQRATAAEVEIELRAQIDLALACGIKPTHLDSHMFALMSDLGNLEAYLRVANDYKLMPMLNRAILERVGAQPDGFEQRGYIVFNQMIMGAGRGTNQEIAERYRQRLRSLAPGVTLLLVHLGGDDEEMKAITGPSDPSNAYSWQERYADLLAFSDGSLHQILEDEGVKLLGFRELSQLWHPA